MHGGILANRLLPEHMTAVEGAGIPLIDLVVVNLYPFRETVAKPGCTLEDAIENIDIGGPTMVRAAAKNWEGVAIVVDMVTTPPSPTRCRQTPARCHARRGSRSRRRRYHTAAYDAAIGNYLTCRELEGEPRAYPDVLTLQSGARRKTCATGENPHQSAAFYRDEAPAGGTLSKYTQLQGKELSYNNVADADAAWECVRAFAGYLLRDRQARQPLRCGAGRYALEPPTTAPLPPIQLGVRRHHRLQPHCRCGACAEAVSKQFLEVLIAPEYTADALALLREEDQCAGADCDPA